ncbi:hypothetical protein DUA64_25375 [Salmonella enterica subsp. enterica serovar Abony]|nr:hypothetical protein [Salmonella enterica subsp. enterica serovar Abony]EBY6401532.1 hypothetical protein [Salmonella enterica subsp. enterica serovar Abony]
MSDFGAMILMDNGNPFVTPQSTPFCLYGKYSFNSSANGSSQQVAQYLSVPADYPVMAFIKTTDTAQPTPVISYRIGGNVYINGVNPYNQSFTLTAYVFAIFQQTLPAWGFAIWDASGKLVLTNESRVLSDLQTVGTPGASGGINIDKTLSGSWAVAPAQLGQTIIVNNSTRPPTIYTINAYSSCRFNGGSTRINAGGTSTGTGSPSGVTNTGISLTAINTAAFD